MTYTETIDYLYGLTSVGIKLGLARIRVLLQALGNPERSIRPLLIAGTNGKGSVAAMAHAVFRAAGIRSSLYTSPHLLHFEERIVVDGEPMPREALCRAVSRLRGLIEELLEQGKLPSHPTYFEVVTALALEHFASRGVDLAALEVGLGGRFDATNAVEPAVAVITRVALDHTHFLGSTLRQVAFEKAGIIRPRGEVVTSNGAGEALEVIRDVARRSGARLTVVEECCRRSNVRRHAEGMSFDLVTPAAEYRDLRLALAGAHQLDNAAAAVLALERLADQGSPIGEAEIRQGLAEVRWPGRLERVAGSPPLLLDCAHNPDGAAALAQFLAGDEDRPVTLLFGVMGDKNVPEMAASLFPLARQVVVTRPVYHRAMDPDDTAALGRPYQERITVEPDPARALEQARELAGPEGLVVAAGSLFLISDLKKILAGIPLDR